MQGHVTGFDSPARCAFRLYLRQGRRWPAGDAVEFKFNPYHDPRNGRFTFAPGGPRSLSDGVVSPRRYAAAPPGGPMGRGGNSRAFHDPMTLQQVFPNFRSAVGSAILAPIDGFFNPTGPANELVTVLSGKFANSIIAQTKKVDPKYFPNDAFPDTFAGQMNYLNNLRMDRAVAFYRVRGDPRPLQVETLRFLQRSVDKAYAEGIRALKLKSVKITLSEQEALGNFIDRQVRRDLREWYNIHRVVSDPRHPVRVVGREYQTEGIDRTYTIPDARVGNAAFDATLAQKTFSMKQIRGFFGSDFEPQMVVIVRPSRAGGSYVIMRPGR
jgi:hypothetical protein